MANGVTYIGPLGNLLPVKCPAPDLPAARYVATSVSYTIYGRAKVQKGRMGTRAFEWSLALATPNDINNLLALHHGVYGRGPFWWYDPVSVKRNMLKPDVAAPFTVGDEPGFTVTAGGAITRSVVDVQDAAGVILADQSLSMAAATTAQSEQIPVIPGLTYALLGYVNPSVAEASTISLQFYNVTNATVGAAVVGTKSTTGWGPIALAATVAPVGAAYARVIIQSGATGLSRFGNFRLAESPVVLSQWVAGHGVARVSILDVPEVYLESYGVTRSDYSAVLQEV